MKKHNLRKAFALSALMAFIITGSAYAESINVGATDPEFNKDVIAVGSNEAFNNAGTVNASESITVDGGTFNNTGTIETGTLEISGLGSDQTTIAGSITATDKIVYHGHPGNQMWRPVSAVLITPDLQIIDTHNAQTGFEISVKY